MGERPPTIDEQPDELPDESPEPERSGEVRYTFAMRYGPALASANFNVWPDVLLLDGGDGIPHWQRIGLDRNELLFILVVLRHYQARGKWPTIPVDTLARYLNLAERRTQELKNTLIKDRYLVRVVRSSGDGKRWPDGLDLSPLFGLLEACLYKYHRDCLTLDVKPIWLPHGPTVRPLDPDDFGTRRRSRLPSNEAASGESARPRDERGALQHTHRVQNSAPMGCATSHSPGAADRTGTEPFYQKSRGGRQRPNSPLADREDRAAAPPGLPDSRFSGNDGDAARLPSKPAPQRSDRQDQLESATTRPDAGSPASGKDKRPFVPNPRLTGVVEHWCRKLHDDDAERTVRTLHHLWWNTRCPLERFLRVLDAAGNITQGQVSKSQVRLTRQDRRAAMPYFIRVVQTLVDGPDDAIDGALAHVITG